MVITRRICVSARICAPQFERSHRRRKLQSSPSLSLPSLSMLGSFACMAFILISLCASISTATDICVSPRSVTDSLSSSPCGISPLKCCSSVTYAMQTAHALPATVPSNATRSIYKITAAERLSLLRQVNMPTIILSAGQYYCDTSQPAGWLMTRAIHVWGSTADDGTPNSVIDCRGTGRAFFSRDSAVFFTNLNIQNGFYDAGPALYVEAGYNTTDSSQPYTPLRHTDGRNRTLYSPLGLTYDLYNCWVQGHVTNGPGAVAIRVEGYETSGVTMSIRSSLFQNNHGGSTTTIPDGIHAGALTFTYNGEHLQNYLYHYIADTSFLDNTGGSDFGTGSAIGAGAVVAYYASGDTVNYNRIRFENCNFLRNQGGNRIITVPTYNNLLEGYSVGAGAYASGGGARRCNANRDEFVGCLFQDNIGGLNNNSPIGEAAGAGAISINLVPYTDAIMTDNTQLIENCNFINNQGGNENNNLQSTYVYNDVVCVAGVMAGGGAGAVSIVYAADAFLADPSQVTQDLQSLNRNQSIGFINNTQRIIGSSFIGNSGGNHNNLFPTPCAGGGGGAGGVLIMYSSTTIEAIIEYNLVDVTNSQFMNNSGGNENNGLPSGTGNGSKGGGASGGLAILFVAGVSACSIKGNVQQFNNSIFQGNTGANYNNYGVVAGSAGGAVTLLYFLTTSIADTAQTPSMLVTANQFLVFNSSFIQNIGGLRNHENGNGGSSGGAIGITIFPYLLSEVNANRVHVDSSVFIGNGGAGSIAAYGALSGAFAYTMTVYSGRSRIWQNTLEFNNCQFLQNQGAPNLQGLNSLAANSGGVAVVFPYPSLADDSGDNLLSIDQSLFFQQSSSSGAAVWVIATLMPFYVSISSSNFLNNSVTQDGGSLKLTDVGGSTILDSYFAGNTANNSAGTLVLSGRSQVEFLRCTLEDNSSKQYGSEIVILTPSVVSLNNCTAKFASGNSLQPQQAGIVFTNVVTISTDTVNSTVVATDTATVALLYDNSTSIVCQPGNIVYTTANSIGCQYCRTNTYSISPSMWIRDSRVAPPFDLVKINPVCLDCEFGADCSLGGSGIRAVVGYYGSTGGVDVSNALSTELQFSLCLPSYCCTAQQADSESVCPTYNTCAPHRLGRLCGRCEDGYGETLGSDECTADDKCNAKNWFFAAALLAGAILATLICAQAAYTIKQRNEDALRHNPDSTYTTSRSLALQCASLLIYFYQLAGQMYLTSVTTSKASFLAALFNALRNTFEFTPSSSQGGGGGVCLWPGMNAVEKQSMYATGPGFVLVPFLVIIGTMLLLKPYSQRLRTMESGTSPVHITTILTVGIVKIGLFGYSTFIRRLLILVHCVEVLPEKGTYLLQSGDVQCMQTWQIGAIIALILMAMYPFLFIYWLQPRKKQRAGNTAGGKLAIAAGNQNARTKRMSVWKHAQVRLVDLLTADFHPKYRYWEGVMLIYRLTVAAFSNLVTHVMIQYLLLFFSTLFMLQIHITFAPFRFPAVQRVQTVVLMMLTVIAACSLPPALMVSVAVNPPAEAVGTQILSWIQFSALTSCGFICLFVLLFSLRAHNKLLEQSLQLAANLPNAAKQAALASKQETPSMGKAVDQAWDSNDHRRSGKTPSATVIAGSVTIHTSSSAAVTPAPSPPGSSSSTIKPVPTNGTKTSPVKRLAVEPQPQASPTLSSSPVAASAASTSARTRVESSPQPPPYPNVADFEPDAVTPSTPNLSANTATKADPEILELIHLNLTAKTPPPKLPPFPPLPAYDPDDLD